MEGKDNEKAKGFMFLKNHGALVAVLDDETAGRFLKGLIYAFWSYGEQRQIADDTLTQALFDVILQSAEEMNYTYFQQRRAAAAKSVEARKNAKSLPDLTTVSDRQRLITTDNNIIQSNTIQSNKNEIVGKATDGNPPDSSALAPEKKKPVFHIFGEYKHVRLTEEQHQKLIADFGEEKTAEYIKRVDEYVQQMGKTYKDYNLTIRNWIGKDETTKPKPFSEVDYGIKGFWEA